MRKKWQLVVILLLIIEASGVYIQQTVFIDPPRYLGGSGLSESEREAMITQVSFRNPRVYAGGSSDDPVVIVALDGPNDALEIDFRNITVVWQDSTGAYRLHPASYFHDPSSIDGQEFAYKVFNNKNASAPVMDTVWDRFGVVIRPEQFTEFRNADDRQATVCLAEPPLRNLSKTFRVETNTSGVSGANVTDTTYEQDCENLSRPPV